MNTKKITYQEELKKLRNDLATMLPNDSLEVFDEDADSLQTNHTDVLKLQAGDTAPDFALANAQGHIVKLSHLLKENRVILTFYRGTWCPYCNLQLSHYQKSLDEFSQLGACLIAVSPQTPDESLTIKEKNDLQFEVLSDNGNIVASKYTTIFKNEEAPLNEMTKLGFDFGKHYSDDSKELPVPAVFIIEKDGTISFARSTGGDYRNRVEAIDIIKALKNDNYEK